MRSIFEMLRVERHARLFFVAHAQSSFGTGIGYVALLLLAYDRHPGPWGITLVLMADFLPAIVLGPLFGAAADRWSRRTCAVVSDVVRAVAFIAIGFVGGIEATIALALVAGFGAGLFQPAILAGLPSLIDRERVPPAMSLYGSIGEVGATLGPALAAGLLFLLSPEVLLVANGVTFALSAALLAVLPFGRPERDPAEAGGPRPSLWRDARAGLSATRRLPGVMVLIVASGAVLLFAGMLNVVELLFAKNDLDVGDSGFAILVALSGLGIVMGNAVGARGGQPEEMRRRSPLGLLTIGISMLAMAASPNFTAAAFAFVALGFGNGLVLVHGRVLLQRIVPEHLLGRVYGVKDAILSGAFGIAFISAGVLVDALGTRTVLAVAGIGGIVVWLVATPLLRRHWPTEAPPAAAPATAEP
jgi:MFS family permease